MTKKMAIGVSVLLALLAFGAVSASANEETLTIERSEDRLSATATWTPSEGAEHQLFFYVGKSLLGEEATGLGLNLGVYKEFELSGDASSLVMSELDPRREYIYAVAKAARDSDGKWAPGDWVIAGLPSPTSAATDRDALVALYDAADGDNWRENANWLSDAPLSDWYGVETDSYGRVVELDLWLNNLEGELPPELGDLAALKRLSLPLNSLNGKLPSELGGLSSLEELILIGNKLTGEIPVQLGGLLNLEKLYLSVGNQYAGCIPAALQHVAVNDLSELGLPFCS